MLPAQARDSDQLRTEFRDIIREQPYAPETVSTQLVVPVHKQVHPYEACPGILTKMEPDSVALTIKTVNSPKERSATSMEIVYNGVVAAAAGGVVALGVWLVVLATNRILQKKEKPSG